MTVTDLACQRGGVRVIEGLSFTLGPGQLLELRGPNGIGKTTLLRTLAGLQPSVAGHIGVDPEALIYASHADGAKATLTVTENLAFWAQTYGQSGIEPALEQLNLQRLAHRFAGQLSAGQKRRLGLSRLLVSGRAVWLLDEPTVSLDAASVALFRGLIEAHCAAGGAALVATHLDLGGGRSAVLDLTPFKAKPAAMDTAFDGAFDGAFL